MSAAYRLARRQNDVTSIVHVGSATFGGGGFTLVGGPCSIESADQIERAAQGVRAAGGAMLRGGAYKPRTSPYDFQGLGDKGLPLIAQAGASAGLPVVVEALAVAQVHLVASFADMIQIGARNMQNVPLLRAAAATGAPILLKRGPSATLDELLLAAEYVLLEGNANVVLCERGIRGFDPHTRNVCDLGGALRLRELTHLPVILDPSHASGRRSLIEPLTLAAAAAGLDGAIVEVHPEPETALCDADQAIGLEEFARLGARVRAVRAVLAEPELAYVLR
jgi:3-deoxy-7-phosphoheptulonate synthase